MTSSKKLRTAVRKGVVDAIEDTMHSMLRNANESISLKSTGESISMRRIIRTGRKNGKITYNKDYKMSEQVSRMLEGLYEECSGECSTTGNFEFRSGMDATFLAYLSDKNTKRARFTSKEITRLFDIYEKHMPSDSKDVKRQLINLGLKM